MPEFHDPVLGKIIVSRGRNARYVRLGVTTTGDIKVSAPIFTPMYFIKNFVKKSRKELSDIVSQYRTFYVEETTVGKSHTLAIEYGASEPAVSYKKPRIIAHLTSKNDLLSEEVQSQIRENVAKALRVEAKAYLPRRVEHIASLLGMSYGNIRFSHAKSRWGSCNSDGTIRLNIALMKLPFELIDYVIVHELAHTKFLDHSADFWDLVESCDPQYKIHKKTLKNYSPHI